jgi:hypothetical protein
LNLNKQLTDLDVELAAINDQIGEKLAPYLANVGAAIPDLGQIDPKLADERNVLLAHYDRVSLARDQLELNSKLRVSSQVIQPASKAALVIPTGGTKKLYAAVIAGFLAGAVAASALASVSKRALDEHDIAEVLGVEVVGVFPKARSVAKNRRAALEALPARMAPFIDKLNVRAEANARIGEAFTVAAPPTNDDLWASPRSWTCLGCYAGRGDSRFCVPNPFHHSRKGLANPAAGACPWGGCCAPRVPNVAHPHCQKIAFAASAVFVAAFFVRFVFNF